MAETRDLQVRTATIDLTPVAAVPMGGHGRADRLTTTTNGRLEANIIVIGDDNPVAIVSIDTLFAGAALTNRVSNACGERFSIPPAAVLVLASHTHTAPMLDLSKPGLGSADPDEAERWGAGIEAAIGMVTAHEACFVRTGSGTSDRSVNRRLRWRLPSLARLLGKLSGDIYLCDNPEGPRDPRVRTIVWLSAEGKPIAAMWCFACHPSGFPDADTASPDFVGVVREALRRRLGPNLPVIFAPGCMGDVRPRSPRPWKRWGRAIQIAIYGPSAQGFDHVSWLEWAAGLADEVVAAEVAGTTSEIDNSSIAISSASAPLYALLDGTSPTPALTAKAVTLPSIARIVALSCEPVTEIANLLADTPDDWILGYEGDVFGYLPTDSIRLEGGYEAQRFMTSFGLTGQFRPGLDLTIAALGKALRARASVA